MAEEMKNQETMEDFAKEIDASFESFRDADMDIWEKLEKMKEDKTEFDVTIEGIVKGGAIAYVEGIRAFIPHIVLLKQRVVVAVVIEKELYAASVSRDQIAVPTQQHLCAHFIQQI